MERKYKILRYNSNYYEKWNRFLSKSKNGNFLFHRDFIEYHKDRFFDFSLLIYNSKNQLIALLPANIVDKSIYSHQGLSYGGLIYEKIGQAECIKILKEILIYLSEQGIQVLYVKSIPFIYHKKLSEEFDFALYWEKAEITQKTSLSVITKSNIPHQYNKLRKRKIKQALNHHFRIKENDFDNFWNKILIPNLRKKYNSDPVHSLQEISLLQRSFPENIKQFTIEENGEILCGITIFESEKVVRTQYISKKINTDKIPALDFLVDYLLQQKYFNKKYFDLGSSNGYIGEEFNENLIYWKESFGASTVCQNHYKISINPK